MRDLTLLGSKPVITYKSNLLHLKKLIFSPTRWLATRGVGDVEKGFIELTSDVWLEVTSWKISWEMQGTLNFSKSGEFDALRAM